jgi:hypothetical protein
LTIYRWISLLFYDWEFPSVFLDVLGDQFAFAFALVLFLLTQLGEDELEPVFDGVLSAALEYLDQPAPLLLPVIFDDVR